MIDTGVPRGGVGTGEARRHRLRAGRRRRHARLVDIEPSPDVRCPVRAAAVAGRCSPRRRSRSAAVPARSFVPSSSGACGHDGAAPVSVDTGHEALCRTSAITPALRARTRRARENGWAERIWEAAAGAGLPWISVPVDVGGSGGSLADVAAIGGAGRFAAPIPLAETHAGRLAAAAAGLPMGDGPMTVATMRSGDSLRVTGSAVEASTASRGVVELSGWCCSWRLTAGRRSCRSTGGRSRSRG